MTRRPEPGDPGWTHPHVSGPTDPAEIKRQLDAIEAAEQVQRDRITRERHSIPHPRTPKE